MQTVPRALLADTTADIAAAVTSAFRGHISGLTLSTAGASATFGVAAGVAVDSTATAMLVLGSAFTCTTAAWTTGSGNGSWDGGGVSPAVTANAWYHVYLIVRPDTGVVDVCVSQSPTSPTIGVNIPAAYTLFRRIGALRTNGSFQWVKFVQVGDEFLWDTAVQDYNSSALSTTATLVPLTVPTGVQVTARLRSLTSSATLGTKTRVSSPDESSVAGGSLTDFNAYVSVVNLVFTSQPDVRTDTSGQVRVVATLASTTLTLFTYGWVDRRGRG